MQQRVAPPAALQGALALCEGLRTNHTIVHLELGYERKRERAQAGMGLSGNWRKWEWAQVGMILSGNEPKWE